MLQKISDDNFDAQVIHSDGIFVLLFSSQWCSTCKNVLLQMESLSEKTDNALFGKIDITESPQKPAQHEVMGIPTVLIFKGGEEITRLTGNVSEKEIEKEINEIS